MSTHDIYRTVVITEEVTQVVQVGFPGPEGPQGPEGPEGPAGPGGAVPFDHAQASASVEWIVNHNLGYEPTVQLRDATGNVGITEIRHISNNQVRLYFNAPIAGKARLI